VYERSHERVNTLWGWVDSDWAADLDSRRSHTGYILMLTGGAVSWKSRHKIVSHSLPLRLNTWQQANVGKKLSTFARSSVISVSFLLDQLRSMKTILRVWLCRKTLSVVNTRVTLIFDAILFVT
jgi:hypothetical protein